MLENNTELIATIVGLIASFAVPHLAPAHMAKFVNVWRLLKVVKNILIAFDSKVDKIEKSKGGLTTEVAKEVLIEDIKEELKEKAAEIIVKKGTISKNDTVQLINEVLQAKDEIAEKVTEVKTLGKKLKGLFK